MLQMEGFRCPSCSQSYTAREPRGNRLPRILKCGHTCCEACIKSRSSQTRVCICPVCRNQQLFPEVKSIQDLPLDTYVIGAEATSSKLLQMPQRPGSSSAPFNLTMKWAPQNRGAGDRVLCEECGERVASCSCDTCPSIYCKLCFEQVHRYGKTMRKHSPMPLRAVPVSREPVQCLEHKRDMEFFCQTDSELICSFCAVMGAHKQHTVVAIVDQNKAALKELKPTLDEAFKSYHGLKRTAKKLENICSGMNSHYQKILCAVQAHFQHLHSLLQLRSHQLLSEVKKADAKYQEDVQEKLKDTISKVKEFQVLQKEVECAVSSADPTNATHLLEKLKSMKNLQCFLVNDFQDHRPEYEILYDPLLIGLLENYGEVRCDIPEKLTLVSVNDLPEDYIEQELDDTDLESVSSAGKRSLEELSTVTSSLSSEDLSSVPTAPAKIETLNEARVKVSHVRDPCHFYVQVCTYEARLKKMQDQVNAFCRSPDSKLVRGDVETGKMYMAMFSDNNWYRCRVLRILSSQTDFVDGTTLELSNVNVEVFYVDYGNSEVVPLTRLRLLAPMLNSLPHLAFKCSLYNLSPSAADDRWRRDSIQMFVKLAVNRKLILKVAERQGDTLLVDLLDSGSESGISDSQTSVSDAMVFLGKARFYFPEHRITDPAPPLRRQFYSPAELISGRVMTVMVSCIYDPNELFVQELGDAGVYMEKLVREIQDYCSTCNETNGIYMPRVGMACLALFQQDGLWYRARVESLLGNSQVEVLYVDYGNKERVSVPALLKIPDKFMRLPSQAIQVSLADVAPTSGKGWPNEVKNRLSKLIANKSVVMKVHRSGKGACPSVTLYIPGREDTDLCVNAVLVRERLATSTGPLSMMVDAPCLIHPSTGPHATSLLDFYEGLKKVAARREQLARLNRAAGSSPVDSLLAAIDLHADVMPESLPPLPPSPPPDPSYVPVQLVDVTSPKGFSVLPLEEKAALTSLKAEMHKACEKVAVRIAQQTWEVGNWCAVKFLSNWERAKVLLVEDNNIKVELVDWGKTETFLKHEVVPLEPALTVLPSMAKRCHLADMIPAGGNSCWSKTAEEYFKETLCKADKVYLLPLGEESDGSLPSDLIMEKVIAAGALEPMRKELKSIREQLKEMGYGFIMKREMCKQQSPKLTPGDALVFCATASGGKVDDNKEGLQETPLMQKATACSPSASLTKEIGSIEFPLPFMLPDLKELAPLVINLGNDSESEALDEEPLASCGSPLAGAALSTPTYGLEVADSSSPILTRHTLFEEDDDTLSSVPVVTMASPPFLEACQPVFDSTLQVAGSGITTPRGSPLLDADLGSPDVETTHPVTGLISPPMEMSLPEAETGLVISDCGPASTEAAEPLVDACFRDAVSETLEDGLSQQQSSYNDASEMREQNNRCAKYSSSDDEDELPCVIDDDVEVFRWKRRDFPNEKQLLVMPSHIDENAIIYVQVLGKDIDTYKMVKEQLFEVYSQLPAPQHGALRVGQACIALYSEDNKYYRAEILGAGESGIEVQFVDYGTMEYVNPCHLFTKLMFEDLPTLCLQVELYGLKPFSCSGTWTLGHLDRMHYMLVEQSCSMVVKKKPTATSHAKVLLFLPDGVSLYEFLLETGIAHKNEEEPLEQYVEEKDEPVPCPYSTVSFPESGVFPVTVTHVVEANVVCCQLDKVAHASCDEQREVNTAVDAFMAMAQELQTVANDCAPLMEATIGTPCIGKYSFDKRWYRAVVTGMHKKKVVVLYVDYGNSEAVSKSRLRALPELYLSIPMQGKVCQFYGVEVIEDSAKVKTSLSELLFESDNNKFLARIMKKDSDPIEIDLLNSSLDLVYQPLAERGYITIDRTL